MRKKIELLCKQYHLGHLLEEPQVISGGLMHRMYRVTTTLGEYAIKVLNQDIMKRPEALQNMINSELVSNALKGGIPLVAAKEFQGKHILELEGAYFVVFDWLDGRSVYAPDITTMHCEQIGRLLGQIHTANVRVESVQKSVQGRETYEWSGLLERAEQENAECYVLLKAHLEDVARWDRQVVEGWQSMAQKQVISHRDLDPKNVMWKGTQPIIIDWEAAGYVNPFQELVEVLNYWIVDENGQYNRDKFATLFRAYSENMDVKDVDWNVVLNCSFDGMLGWLEYNVKRAVGIEGSDKKDRQEGLQQVTGTLQELKRYEAQLGTLRDWIAAYYKD